MNEYPLKWITDYLAVSYAPRSIGQLQSIRAAGIGAIVNLCAECYDLHEAEKEADFDVFYLPIADEKAPSLEQMDATIRWLDHHRETGNKVLVHCRYGIGRTGTVVLIHLLHCGVSFKQAQIMMKHTPSWPSTSAQKNFVDEYIAEVLGKRGPFHAAEKSSNLIGKFFKRLEAISKWDD